MCMGRFLLREASHHHGGEADRQLKTERDRISALERDLAETRAKLPKAEPPPPRPAAPVAFASFEQYVETHPSASYEEYIDARAEARAEAKAEALVTQRFTADRQRLEAESADRAIGAALQQISIQGPKLHANFEAAMTATAQAGLQMAPHVSGFVVRHTDTLDEAVELVHRLLTDHALLQRVNQLPPARAHYELGKLISATPTAAPGSAVPAPVTSAPAPTRPVVGSASVSPTVASVVASGEFSLAKFRAAKAKGRT